MLTEEPVSHSAPGIWTVGGDEIMLCSSQGSKLGKLKHTIIILQAKVEFLTNQVELVTQKAMFTAHWELIHELLEKKIEN